MGVAARKRAWSICRIARPDPAFARVGPRWLLTWPGPAATGARSGACPSAAAAREHLGSSGCCPGCGPGCGPTPTLSSAPGPRRRRPVSGCSAAALPRPGGKEAQHASACAGESGRPRRIGLGGMGGCNTIAASVPPPLPPLDSPTRPKAAGAKAAPQRRNGGGGGRGGVLAGVLSVAAPFGLAGSSAGMCVHADCHVPTRISDRGRGRILAPGLGNPARVRAYVCCSACALARAHAAARGCVQQCARACLLRLGVRARAWEYEPACVRLCAQVRA
jgi:hypothetical protein